MASWKSRYGGKLESLVLSIGFCDFFSVACTIVVAQCQAIYAMGWRTDNAEPRSHPNASQTATS